MRHLLLPALAFAMLVWGCNGSNDKAARRFINEHVAKIRSLQKDANLAYWEAAISGQGTAYDRYSQLELQVRQIYSDQEDFTFLKKMTEQGGLTDPLLARQIEVLYYSYLENQMAPDLLQQITVLGAEVEKKFSTFRGSIGPRKVTANEIDEILKKESKSQVRREAWLASKQVGPVVAADLIALVKLRNEAAQKLGFKNFHAMSLATSEQDEKELDAIFAELYQLSEGPFTRIKAELDEELARRYKVAVTDLQPWHYHDPFFQESPMLQAVDLDKYYQGKDVKKLAADFFAGIDLPVETILMRSDLYEKEGKNPHAFCTDIDREGDVRILCNLQNNERWMETILHELGHGVYDKYQDMHLPYLLRQPAHTFTTEAIAMFFGRLSRNPAWMQSMLGLDEAKRTEIESVSNRYAQLKQLIFARWAMVMYSFEKELYANPDQDLNALWWNLVEKYQGLKKPVDRNEPDWAAKIHFAIAPCYYHNYLLGELLASQLYAHIDAKVARSATSANAGYVDEKPLGGYLRQQIFAVGARYPWNEMITRATGEPLTAKYFIEQFVN